MAFLTLGAGRTATRAPGSAPGGRRGYPADRSAITIWTHGHRTWPGPQPVQLPSGRRRWRSRLGGPGVGRDEPARHRGRPHPALHRVGVGGVRGRCPRRRVRLRDRLIAATGPASSPGVAAATPSTGARSRNTSPCAWRARRSSSPAPCSAPTARLLSMSRRSMDISVASRSRASLARSRTVRRSMVGTEPSPVVVTTAVGPARHRATGLALPVLPRGVGDLFALWMHYAVSARAKTAFCIQNAKGAGATGGGRRVTGGRGRRGGRGAGCCAAGAPA